MKRVQALMLALLLAFTLCITGCSNTNAEPQATAEPEPTKEVIELTTSNWSKYLKARVHVSEPEHKTVRNIASYYLCDISVELYPIQGGHFNNVKLTLRIVDPYTGLGLFSLEEHDEITFVRLNKDGKEYRDGDGVEYRYCYFNDIVLPASGEYTTSSAEYLFYSKDSFDTSRFNAWVKEISGTFVPD